MKNPHLKFKYVNGLGDLIACILHSAIFGWFTRIVTGKKEPCQACSHRRRALNVLFPFKMWKLFFNSIKEYMDSLYLELKTYGIDVEILEKERERILVEHYNQNSFNEEKKQKNNLKKENKDVDIPKLVSTNKVQLEGYLIKTEIYKI
jgi:hypothetical protein